VERNQNHCKFWVSATS